ncbi:MAG: hypothetical protein OHK0053_00840 [Microscillaceae bacterium]
MKARPSAQEWIAHLQLAPHPEGGYYRETYRSSECFTGTGDFPAARSWATAIYFLLTSDTFSAFHRIRADEMWHFYAGAPLDIYQLSPGGGLQTTRLGPEIQARQVLQAVVPAGVWFGAKLVHPAPEAYALVGCTVSPGFDFRDFELAQRQALTDIFPEQAALIAQLTRD